MQNPTHIRHITRNFDLLQGLIMVPMGATWLIVTAINAGWRKSPGEIALPFGLIILMIIGMVLARLYYNRKFGKIQTDLAILIRNIVFSLVLLPLVLVPNFLEQWGVPLVTGLPFSLSGMGWAAVLAAQGWILKRKYYYGFAGLLVLVSLLPLVGISTPQQLFSWSEGTWGFFILGVSFMMIGLLDHNYLTSSLPVLPEAQHERSI